MSGHARQLDPEDSSLDSRRSILTTCHLHFGAFFEEKEAAARVSQKQVASKLVNHGVRPCLIRTEHFLVKKKKKKKKKDQQTALKASFQLLTGFGKSSVERCSISWLGMRQWHTPSVALHTNRIVALLPTSTTCDRTFVHSSDFQRFSTGSSPGCERNPMNM